MRRRVRRAALWLTAVAAVVAGVWMVSSGWLLREVHAEAVSTRPNAVPTPAEVLDDDEVAGVDLVIVRFSVGDFERKAAVVAPPDPPAPGGTTHVRVVTPEVAQSGQQLYAVDLVRGASRDHLAGVGRRANLLFFGGLVLTVVAAFVVAAGLHLLTADPKRQTMPHVDRHGS